MAKSLKREKQNQLYKQKDSSMPEGCYSGDKPNTQLRAFVETHLEQRPYIPEVDGYNVAAFDKPIDTTKATAIYNMHTYWSKKPHDAIRQYIRHYTQPGDIVLDPFCGSGGTALAALIEERKAIAIDRSPAATFITKNYCTPVDVEELKKEFETLKLQVESEIKWLYETKCDRCGGKATTRYTVYSQVFRCGRCMEKVPLFDCVEVEGRTAKGEKKTINACPSCRSRGIVEEITSRGEKFGSIPVLVNYSCESGCTPSSDQRRHNDLNDKKRQYFEKFDIGKIKDIESKTIPHWHPNHRMMNAPEALERWGVKWRAGTSNFRTVDELFTKRNLWALAAIRSASERLSLKDVFFFALSAVSLALSRMQRYSPDSGFPNMVLTGTYYVPQIGREIEVLNWYAGKFSSLIKGFEMLAIERRDCIISTDDARRLDIPSNSVDYIFTDPPYADNVQYGELNFIWEALLDLDTRWHPDEIIVNDVQGKSEADWAIMMREAMTECYRVLKPGHWLSLCYHDASEGTWKLVQDLMAEVGFMVDSSDSALFIDTRQKSFNQLTADKVTKRDLVINFRKPRLGEIRPTLTITGEEDVTTFNEKASAVIREYLTENPGATKDRAYDEVVSHMVRAGRMEAHDFDELLLRLAEEVRVPVRKNLVQNEDPNLLGTHEISRWYLKETEMSVVDSAESAKEDLAAAKIESIITEHLTKNRGAEGVHYSDLFEHFVYTIKDKPRRPLAEWLLDYFYKTESGMYRLPASEEEQSIKKQGRVAGTNRRIKRYISYLQQGVTVPEKERPSDSTLAEWIRSAKRSGMYEAGKLLYEKGGLNLDTLPEELVVNVEEDYQVCTRMLARTGDQGRATKRKTRGQ